MKINTLNFRVEELENTISLMKYGSLSEVFRAEWEQHKKDQSNN
jgi:hypothetical protein